MHCDDTRCTLSDMGRLLGRIRLSRDTDASTSRERQVEVIETYAKLHGHEVVGWAVDMDVSGSVSPFDTPELGSWLARPDDWDTCVAWKLDRFGRTLFALNDLFSWCQRNGKVLACVEDHIDLSHWTGRLVAAVIAGVAEGELEAIKTRTAASQSKLRELGRWHGGVVPWGYQKVKRGDGWYMEVDEGTAPQVHEVVKRVLAGESVLSVAKSLNERGIKPPQASQWSDTVLRRMLRSRWIIGQWSHRGRVYTDEDGMPQQRAEPLVPFDTWRKLQAVLDDRRRSSAQAYGTSLLLHVAFCLVCGAPLYHHVSKKPDRGTTNRYYRCSNRIKSRELCSASSTMPAALLESFTEEQLLEEIGDLERVERIYVPGDDSAERLDQITRSIETARKEKDLGLYEGDEDSYLERIKNLAERRKILERSGSSESGWKLRGLGETYREAWGRMATDERRKLLLDTGVTISVRTRPWEAAFHVPQDVMRKAVPAYNP